VSSPFLAMTRRVHRVKCGSGSGSQCLTGHAFRTQVVFPMHNREDGLLTALRLNREFDVPFLDVEHSLPASPCEQIVCPREIRR